MNGTNAAITLENVRLLDPAAGLDAQGSLTLAGGLIAPLAAARQARRLDACGWAVAPGFLDLHVHFREPGGEAAETIASGARAAARGGFTTVLTMPNTRPPIDTPVRLRAALARHAAVAASARVLAAACVTRERAGRELADLEALAAAGALAFSDDGAAVGEMRLMRAALAACARLNRPLLQHALDPAARGVAHDGAFAARHAFPGITAAAETDLIARDLALAAETGGALHIQHVSAASSLPLLAAARRAGLRVTAEATPHHLFFCDDDISDTDTNYKMAPPLRTAADRAALRLAVSTGEIGVLATDHAPHTAASKALGWLDAPFGVLGLESAVGASYRALVVEQGMAVLDWVACWTVGPARVLGLPAPGLAVGAAADLVVLDLDAEWTITADDLSSQSRNCPFLGHRLHGRVVATLLNGRCTWASPEWIERGSDHQYSTTARTMR